MRPSSKTESPTIAWTSEYFARIFTSLNSRIRKRRNTSLHARWLQFISNFYTHVILLRRWIHAYYTYSYAESRVNKCSSCNDVFSLTCLMTLKLLWTHDSCEDISHTRTPYVLWRYRLIDFNYSVFLLGQILYWVVLIRILMECG